jgi:hypothetical protein
MSKVAASYERCVKTLKDFGWSLLNKPDLVRGIKSGKVATACAGLTVPAVPPAAAPPPTSRFR